MKSKNKAIRYTGYLFFTVFLLVMAFFLLPETVFAMPPADDNPPLQSTLQPDDPLPPDNPEEQDENFRMGRLLEQEKRNHERQQGILNKADNAVDRISEMIAGARENGKDTQILDQAVAAFNEQLAEARLAYDRTGILIHRHEGFDDKGKVIDRETARKTVESIRDGTDSVRKILIKALQDLREAGKSYREANPRPVTQPVSDPA